MDPIHLTVQPEPESQTGRSWTANRKSQLFLLQFVTVDLSPGDILSIGKAANTRRETFS